MTDAQLSIIIAICSLIFAVVATIATRTQAQQAKDSNRLTEHFARSEVVMHFTDRFFDLLKEGDPTQKLVADPVWTYQFWSLQATEFYFFHHRLLPRFMYSLWMADLAKLYVEPNGEQIRQSHMQYLNIYSLHYDAMSSFFDEIYRLAKTYPNEIERNSALAQFIKLWLDENRRDSFE